MCFRPANDRSIFFLPFQNRPGCFHTGDQYTFYFAIFSECRTVTECPVNIFHLTITIERYQLIFKPYRFMCDNNLLKQWADKMPNFAPHCYCFFANSRMFTINAKAWTKCLIVKAEKIITPEQEHWKGRVKYIAKSNL